MKAKPIVLILVALCLASSENGQPRTENRVKIGILTLEKYNKADAIAEKAQYQIATLIKEIGFYECFDQASLEALLQKRGDKMPKRLRDPKGVVDVGKLTGMDRMLFGSIEWDNSVAAVKLTLIDVHTRQTIETVSLQGESGVAIDEVLSVACTRLHGREAGSEKTQKYFGPAVHNERQLLMSSAACLGVGLLYGIVNYSIKQQKDPIITAAYTDDKLSGISSTTVPLFARPAALANAYTALSDDAYGVLYNPAGMAWVTGPQGVFAYQYRFGLDNIAATYVNRATREIGFGQALLYRADRDQLMTELYFVSACAYKFNNLPYGKPCAVGANLHVSSNRVKSTSPISSGGNSLGIGIDAGFMWELSEEIRYGLIFKDIPVFNYWHNETTGERYFESQPTTLTMGGIFKAGYSTLLIADGQIPLYEDQPWKMAGGIEQEFFNLFCIRAGLQREIMTTWETPWHVTCGFGLKVITDYETGKSIALDGSYEYSTLQEFDVINVSLRVAF